MGANDMGAKGAKGGIDTIKWKLTKGTRPAEKLKLAKTTNNSALNYLIENGKRNKSFFVQKRIIAIIRMGAIFSKDM